MSKHYHSNHCQSYNAYDNSAHIERVSQLQNSLLSWNLRLSELFKFHKIPNEIIQDSHICGINGMHVWCRLLSEWDLAYQLAYDNVLAMEVVYKNTKDWPAGDCTTETEYGYHGDASEPWERKHADIQALWEKEPQRERDCTFLDAECYYCCKQGHIAAACKVRKDHEGERERQNTGNEVKRKGLTSKVELRTNIPCSEKNHWHMDKLSPNVQVSLLAFYTLCHSSASVYFNFCVQYFL